MNNIVLFNILNFLDLLIFVLLTIQIYELRKRLKNIEIRLEKQRLRQQIIYSD